MCKWRLGFWGRFFPVVVVVLAIMLVGGDGAAAQPADPVEPEVTVEASPRSPAAARYEVTFTTKQSLQVGLDGIVMTLDEDVGVPRFIPPPAVQVRFQKEDGDLIGSGRGTAVAVELDNQDDPRRDTTLTIYPVIRGSGADDPPQPIPAEATVTLVFTKQAGLSNPTEGGAFSWTVSTTKDAKVKEAYHPDEAVRQAFGEAEEGADPDRVTGLLVDREVQLSHEGVSRGNEITVIGRGYKNGTTLTFWRDANFDGVRDSGEFPLCRAEVLGNDIGSCSFLVSNPPFVPGFGNCDLKRPAGKEATCNFVNAVDGLNQPSTLVIEEGATNEEKACLVREADAANVEKADQVLELEGAVLVGPGVAPGRTIQVQLTDFPPGELSAVDIGGVPADLDDLRTRTVPASGSLHFSIALPNRAREGRQSLRVAIICQVNDKKEFEARATVWVGSSALLRVTPEQEVLPNQRISVSGVGFSDAGEETEIDTISIGGHPIDSSRINGGNGPVRLDRGGRWSASIDLPINSATTLAGPRELRARDKDGREGTALVTFPAREVTITPPWGRPGTTAVIEGKNFPSRNDNGSPFNLLITYDAGGREAVFNAATNTGGEFATEIRIPTSAAIPSINTVRVEFVDDDGVKVVTPATHHVPGAAIVLSRTAGPPGTPVTLAGQGFRQYVPVTSVMVGVIEVTPSPRPYTDQDGDVTLEVIIPGVDTGVQTVTLMAGGVTASAGFTITRSGVAEGESIPTADGVANLGDRFVRSFHFDNDTKTWEFYDPVAGDANTQDSLISGESYWLLVTETTETILNGKTRQLTCVRGNCWNLLVW